MKAIGITSPFTGSGKTSVTIGLLNKYKNSIGVKIGPDYIDGMFHTYISGNRTLNIDRWIQGKKWRDFLSSVPESTEVVVVEGVMGLFDSGMEIDLSSHWYFDALGIPYILVVDVEKMAESAYAMSKGFLGRHCAGVIINNFYSEKHYAMVSRNFIKNGVKILASIPHLEKLKIEERHLGLHLPDEVPNLMEKAKIVSSYIPDDLIQSFGDIDSNRKQLRKTIPQTRKKIKVAMDKAFIFYYSDSLAFLDRLGDVEFFSPLSGESCEGGSLIYIGGGYPELYANEISKSRFIRDLKAESLSDTPIIAECGGMMVTLDTLTTDNGEYKMAGIFSGKSKMGKIPSISYTKLVATDKTLLFRKGEVAYGHEFHYSRTETSENLMMENIRGNGINGKDVLYTSNTQASYSHFSLARYGRRLQDFLMR